MKKRLQFGWDFDMVAAYSTDIANAMETQLLQKFQAWSAQLNSFGVKKPFCKKPDCSDMTVIIKDYNANFRIVIDINTVE